MDQSKESKRSLSPTMAGAKPGTIVRTGSKGGGSSTKKKKKSSRRRKDNEIYKATDTSVNGLRQLRSIVFQKDSKIIKTPHEKQKLPAADGQFDNAPEVADLAQLRQYHSTTAANAMAHPPFGFFSLHPSTLSLHPRSAVHLFYPTTPLLVNSGPNQNQNGSSSNSNTTNNNNNQRLGMGLGQTGFSAAAAAGLTPTAAAAAAAMSPFHNPRLVQQQKLSGLSPATTPHALAQHHPGMPGLSTQQLQSAAAAAAAAGGQPTFMEYAAAMKRQQLQLEKYRQEEAHKLQQEVALKEEHLKALSEKQQAAMRQQLNAGALTPAAMMARQAQQTRGPGATAQRQAREQMQQKQHAAAVMASLGQQQQSQPAAKSAQQMLAQRQRGVSGEERSTSPKPSEQPPMGSAMMALAAVRESTDRAAAAAALLGQYSREETRKQQQQQQQQHNQQVLAAMSGMSGMLKQQQQRPLQPGQLSPKQKSVPVPDPRLSPMSAAAAITKKELEQHAKLPPPALNETASQGSYEDDEGPRLFVRKQPITSADPSPLTSGMEQLETLPMKPYTAPDNDKKYPVKESEITDCDVLLGRGGMTNHHVGNMHFRTLVSEFRLHYCTAKKGDKGRLSKRLTNFVRHKKGRFLQKDDADNMWYECGDQRAHGKCAQALREGTAELMRHVTESEGGPVPPEDLPNAINRVIGRAPVAMSAASSDSDGPPMPALHGYQHVPRGGIMGGATRMHPGHPVGAPQVSPRSVFTNGDGGKPQRPPERSSSPKPKRPRSPKRSGQAAANAQPARKKSPVMHSQGIKPTIVDQEYVEESGSRSATDANRRRSEVSEGQSDDGSDEELLGSRKRAKIEEDEEEEQDYEYM